MMNKNYCNTYINNFPKTPKNDPKRPHVLPRTPKNSAAGTRERDRRTCFLVCLPERWSPKLGERPVLPPQAFSIKKLEASTNPVREESQTTVGNPNVDYKHELIFECPSCYALLCFAWQCFVLLFHVVATFCYVFLCFAMLRCAMLCYPVLDFAVLCYIWLRCDWLCFALLCLAVL